VDLVKNALLNENPMLLMVDWKDGGYHFVVVVGMEYDIFEDETYKVNKLFILDPLGEEPKYTYWNQIITVGKKNSYKWLTAKNNSKGYFSVGLNNGIVVEDKI